MFERDNGSMYALARSLARSAGISHFKGIRDEGNEAARRAAHLPLPSLVCCAAAAARAVAAAAPHSQTDSLSSLECGSGAGKFSD